MASIDTKQLNEKAKKAIENDLFSGQEIFNDEELNYLRNCVRVHENLSPLEVEYFFILITNYTKDIDPRQWRETLGEKFNCNSNNDLTKLFEEIFSKISKRRFLFKSGQKYYSTFMCQALAPKESLYSFFSLCNFTFFLQPRVFNSNGEIDFDTYAKVFRTRFRTSLNSDSAINLGGNFYDIRIGLKRLADEYPSIFSLLFKRTYEYIEKLKTSPDYVLDDTDNYFIQLINEWCQLNSQEVASKEYGKDEFEEKAIDILPSPEVTFKLLGDNLYLSISNFCVDSDIGVKFEIFSNDESIDYGYLDVISESIVQYAKGRDIRLESSQIKGLKVVITIGDNQLEPFILDRDFILFPLLGSGRSVKEIKGNKLKTGDYILYCEDFDDTFAKYSYPDEIVSSLTSPYLYSLAVEDGDILESENRRVIFFAKEKYDRPELIVSNTKAIYSYQGREYFIISDNKTFFRYNEDDTQYAIRCFDANQLDSYPIFESEIRETHIDSYEDSKIATVQLNNISKETPYVIRLFDKRNTSGYFLDQKRIIYIPNFEVHYQTETKKPEICFNGEAVPFSVCYDDKIEHYSGQEDVLFFLGGTLKLINPPIFQFFIDGYKAPKTPFNIYYNQFEQSSVISFSPNNIDFEVMIDDEVINMNKFGQFIYYYSNGETIYKNVVVKYHDALGTERKVNLMNVFYRPAFVSSPLTKSNLQLPFRFKWSPSHLLIGCQEKNPTFKLNIDNGKYVKLLSLSDEEIDLHGIIPYGTVSYTVTLKYENYEERVYIFNATLDVGSKYDYVALKKEKYLPISKVQGMWCYPQDNGEIKRGEGYMTLLSQKYYLAYKNEIYDFENEEYLYIGKLCLMKGPHFELVKKLNDVSLGDAVIISKKTKNGLDISLTFFNEDLDITKVYYIKEHGERFILDKDSYGKPILSVRSSKSTPYCEIYQIKNDISEDD